MFLSLLRSFPQRIRASKTVVVGLLSGVLGLATGAGVWLFKYLYGLLKSFSFTWLMNLFPPEKTWLVALVPCVGGLIVGLLVYFYKGKDKVDGTAGIIQSVEIAGGRLRYQHLPMKTLTAILSIGTGASVGPEDPSVQIGANIGSFVGQALRLSEVQTVTLVASGAAAAIAAAFNAPIAGVFFGLEIVVGDITGGALGMILIAAVTSSAFIQVVSGATPAFQGAAYSMNSGWELLLYVGLGLIAGPVSAAYVYLLHWMQDFFRKWTLPRYLQTAAAGLVLGFVGIFLPQLFGVGYDTISLILTKTNWPLWLLAALFVGKLVMTPISIGGGFVGGVFAPALFIGASLGGAYGILMHSMFPALGITPSAYALVGMAAVLAGAVHAPLTAAILLFEMTGDYRIILPLMLSVAISLLISQRIQPRSVYSLGLAKKGFFLNRGREIDVLDTIEVKEVMNTSVQPLCASDTIETARSKIAKMHSRGLPVVDHDEHLVGVFTAGDLDAVGQAQKKEASIEPFYRKNPQVTYPKEALSTALKNMSLLNVGQLPVVLLNDPRRLVGMLYREDIINAYRLASQRRLEQKYSVEKARLDAVTPEQVDINETIVEKNSILDGKPMKEIHFPEDCIIASVRRKNKVMIPHGNTIIRNGDILVVVAQGKTLGIVRELCKSGEIAQVVK